MLKQRNTGDKGFHQSLKFRDDDLEERHKDELGSLDNGPEKSTISKVSKTSKVSKLSKK